MFIDYAIFFYDFGHQDVSWYPELFLIQAELPAEFVHWDFKTPAKVTSLPPSKSGKLDTSAAGWSGIAAFFGVTTEAMRRQIARDAVRAAFRGSESLIIEPLIGTEALEEGAAVDLAAEFLEMEEAGFEYGELAEYIEAGEYGISELEPLIGYSETLGAEVGAEVAESWSWGLPELLGAASVISYSIQAGQIWGLFLNSIHSYSDYLWKVPGAITGEGYGMSSLAGTIIGGGMGAPGGVWLDRITRLDSINEQFKIVKEAYGDKDIFFRKRGKWWDGRVLSISQKIPSHDFIEHFDEDAYNADPDQAIPKTPLTFNLQYNINSGLSFLETTTNIADIQIRDGFNRPGGYRSPYKKDFLKKYPDIWKNPDLWKLYDDWGNPVSTLLGTDISLDESVSAFDEIFRLVGGSGIDMFDSGVESSGLTIEGVESGSLVGEASKLSAGTLELGLELLDIIGKGSSILRFVITPIMVALSTHGYDDLASYIAAGSESGLGYKSTYLDELAGIDGPGSNAEAERTAIKAYTGLACYFYNFGYWWDGTIESCKFVTKTYVPTSVTRVRGAAEMKVTFKKKKEELKGSTHRYMEFTISYKLNRGEGLQSKTVNMQRVWLRDDEHGTPAGYVSPYIVDTYLSEHDGKEDYYSVGWSNNMKKHTRPPPTLKVLPGPDFETIETVPEKGVLEKVDPVVTTVIHPKTEESGSVPEIVVTSGDSGFSETYPLAIYREPVQYVSAMKKQLRYAVGTSAIIMFLSIL